MKKFLISFILVLSMIIFSQIISPVQLEAADEWVYTNSNGIHIYIERESVVYGVRTSFYAKARVKVVNPSRELIGKLYLEFNHDEGDWWYSINGDHRNGRRVYDDEGASEILNWLRAHRGEAKKTANPLIEVLDY